MKTRYYQEQSIASGLEHIKQSPVLVLPTGAGKSIVIKELASNLKNGVLVLQPNKEILEQNFSKYSQYSSDCAIFSASCGVKEINRVTFATIGSIIKKKHLFQDFQNIIVDECHLVDAKDGMYANLIKSLKANTIGLTATPYRVHSSLQFGTVTKMITRTRSKLFNFIGYNINPRGLIEQGFLSKINYFNVKLLNDNLLRVNMNGSEFTGESVQSMISGSLINIVNFLTDVSKKHKSVLVFSPSVDFSEKLSEYMNYNNITSATISSSSTKQDRENILKKFKDKSIKIVINVGTLTTGFDYPELDCVVLLRPTMSISLYYQMIGRGIRVADNKTECSVYDLCGNVKRFGKIEDFEIKGNKGSENLFSVINNTKIQLTHINKSF